MPKWIDVKDRLPDTIDTVIVRTVNNTGCAIECEGGRTFCVKESYENVQKMIGVYQNDEMPHL